MQRRYAFIVSVFLVFTLALSGMVFGQRVIDLDKVWGDMRVLGDDSTFGYSVSYGDINGDGFMDIIIGAPQASPNGRLRAGKVYVIFGSSNILSTINLNTQSADITICGDEAEDKCGYAVASGDINGDDYDDIIIGALYANPDGLSCAGIVYVIFGSNNPPSIINLHTQSASITICGESSADGLGNAVASGDVNGDDYNDIIIGAAGAGWGLVPPGKTYVIFGKSSIPSIINLSTQSADITFEGRTGELSGCSVASGDINGDCYDDIIIGAYNASPPGGGFAGKTYVIFGSNFTPPVVIGTGSTAITVNGDDAGDQSGYAVASGDINGDGYDDLIIGAPYADPSGGTDAGETYVIFGANFTPPVVIDLGLRPADITVYGDDEDDFSGRAVCSGDINKDGYDDIIIGADEAYFLRGWDVGETYIVFGSSSPSSTIDLNSQSADIIVYGDDEYDHSGFAVASGDINNDGYYDIIIGAYYAARETYLISGGGAFITAHGLGGKSWIKELSLLTNSLNSFKAFGAVNSEGEVHLAIGDVDADSLDEIAAGQGEGGKSWVKFFEVDGSPISAFKAFGAANTNGEVHLALGNFDEDTSDKEIAVTQGEGGQSWVKLFETDGTIIRGFKAFGAANAQGEVHLASGDLNKDGIDEIIVGMGEGGSSWVKEFNLWGDFIRSFRAFDATDNPGGEVHLAVGNFDADPAVEIAAATGYNGGNKVRLFDKDGTSIGEFTAFGFGDNPNGDVQITAADINNDGVEELICGHGEGGSSVVKVFKPDGTLIRSFKAFGTVNAQGEVHLGKSNY